MPYLGPGLAALSIFIAGDVLGRRGAPIKLPGLLTVQSSFHAS